MKRLIDPKVDYAFKRLFGAEENRDLLMHFLNAVLAPTQPITAIELLNPSNDREALSDKMTILDVKARDRGGAIYQLEVQLYLIHSLAERIIYSWADTFTQQLLRGEGYEATRPTISIWILAGALFSHLELPHLEVETRIRGTQQCLSRHFSVHILQLEKLILDSEHLDDKQRWLYFLKKAGEWEDLPEFMQTPPLRKAMDVLKEMARRQENYWEYAARRDALREYWTFVGERDNAVAKLDAAVAERDSAVAKLDSTLSQLSAAESELEDLRRRLREAGLEG